MSEVQPPAILHIVTIREAFGTACGLLTLVFRGDLAAKMARRYSVGIPSATRQYGFSAVAAKNRRVKGRFFD